jgi:hypothetical protein
MQNPLTKSICIQEISRAVIWFVVRGDVSEDFSIGLYFTQLGSDFSTDGDAVYFGPGVTWQNVIGHPGLGGREFGEGGNVAISYGDSDGDASENEKKEKVLPSLLSTKKTKKENKTKIQYGPPKQQVILRIVSVLRLELCPSKLSKLLKNVNFW